MIVYGPIIWSSKKQSEISISSTEVEYRGDVIVATQCLWLQRMLGEFWIEVETSTIIYCEI